MVVKKTKERQRKIDRIDRERWREMERETKREGKVRERSPRKLFLIKQRVASSSTSPAPKLRPQRRHLDIKLNKELNVHLNHNVTSPAENVYRVNSLLTSVFIHIEQDNKSVCR